MMFFSSVDNQTDLEEIREVVWYERGIKRGINLIWKMGN